MKGDHLFIVSGKGTRLNDAIWMSNSPANGITTQITNWKKAFNNHIDDSYEPYFVEMFNKWRENNKPLKAKKQNAGVIEIYEIPVYPGAATLAPPRGWNTSMARYDIYNVNGSTNMSMHIPEADIVKPIAKAYLVYSQQKYIFIHLFEKKNEAMAWYNSTGITESNTRFVKTFESFLNESQDIVTFSIDDDSLDQLLHDNHKRELDYVKVKGDDYYTLPKREFDRFIDAANSRGFDVDYENSEESVVYIQN
ncbi:hypothetical protein EBU94_04255 [bacterium]|nr:hypothetical protein [bacterium]